MIQLVNEMKSFKDTVDVLVAYPLVGPNLGALVRVSQTPGARQVKLSVLVECEEALDEAETVRNADIKAAWQKASCQAVEEHIIVSGPRSCSPPLSLKELDDEDDLAMQAHALVSVSSGKAA